MNGYVKPLLIDWQILRWKDDHQNPLQFVWESIVSVIGELVTNQSHDQLGSKIPIRGSLKEPEVGSWRALLSLLRNAFMEALKKEVDG